MDEEVLGHDLEDFLRRHHSDQVSSIILSPDSRLHYPLHVDFAELLDFNPDVAHLLYCQPAKILPMKQLIGLRTILLEELKFKGQENASLKEYVQVRINISGSPLEFPDAFPSIGRVRAKHRGILLSVKGTVIRSGGIKMIEGERLFECRRCKHRWILCSYI